MGATDIPFSKFSNFSLMKIRFPRPNKDKMSDLLAACHVNLKKKHSLWGRTCLYSPYKGVLPGRGAQRPKLEAEEASKEYARKELRASICKGRSVKKERGEKKKRGA